MFHPIQQRAGRSPRGQWSLAELFGLVNGCAVAAAMAAIVGTSTSAALIGMSLALWFQQGVLAVASLALATLLVDVRADLLAANPLAELVASAVVFAVAAALAGAMIGRARGTR